VNYINTTVKFRDIRIQAHTAFKQTTSEEQLLRYILWKCFFWIWNVSKL